MAKLSQRGWLLVPACFLFCLSFRAAEFTAHWSSGASGNWSDPGNWTFDPAAPAGTIPQNTGADVFDVVLLSNGAAIRVDVPVTIRNLNYFCDSSIGGLAGTADLTVGGDLYWTKGVMHGSGTTTVLGTAALSGPGPFEYGLDQRNLTLRGVTSLSSDFGVEAGAQITNDVTGIFTALPGAFTTLPADSSRFINLGKFEIASGGGNSEFLHFINANRVDLQTNRTASFAHGLVQDTGKLRLDGGTIDSVVTINGGELSGYGHVKEAVINATLTPSPRTLDFDVLTLGPASLSSFALGGTNAGVDYDRVSAGQCTLGGALEVHFANNFGGSVQKSDRFAILLSRSRVGEFVNVEFGRRLFTSDGLGSFVVESGTNGVVLTDFDVAPLNLQLASGSTAYGFPPETCLVDPTASLGSTSLLWGNGHLEVMVVSGFDPATDGLQIQSVGDAPGQIAVGGLTGGAAQIRFGGTPVGTVQTDATSGRLTASFDPGATTDAVQAVLRNLTYTNRGFSIQLFSGGPVHPAKRQLQFSLTDPSGNQAGALKEVVLPDLNKLKWRPAEAYLDFGAATALDLYGTFIYDQTLEDREVLFSVDPFTPEHDCVGALQITESGAGHIRIVANANLEADECKVSYRAGNVEGDAYISVGSNCTLIFLQILSYFLSISQPPEAPFHPDHPLALAASGPSVISLAHFRALQSLMDQSVEGRRLAAVYAQHTREVVSILKTNSALARAAVQLVLDFQPAVSALLSGNGSSAAITQAMVDELNSVWSQLTSAASPQLQSALETERARFGGFQQFVGRNFVEWAGLLQLPAPFTPYIVISRPTRLDGRFSAEANDVTGLGFSLWRTPDFGFWEEVPGARIQSDGLTVSLADTNPPPRQTYYQVRTRSIVASQ